MPLPPSSVPREPLHDRSIRAKSYFRQDGLIDIEAELLDVKGYDFTSRKGLRPAGTPVHHMHLRVTIDEDFNIVEAVAAYDAAPYDERCSSIQADYANLVGLNLVRGFRHQVRDRFGATAGCTHLSELALVLPTVAIQSRSRHYMKQAAVDSTVRPFAIDGCHALRHDGSVVQEFHPRWYGVPKGGLPHPEPTATDSLADAGSALSSPSSSSDS